MGERITSLRPIVCSSRISAAEIESDGAGAPTKVERNLFLPLQLLDLGFRLVIALNLVDEAWREGLRIDARRLARLLGVPVVPTVAIRGQGLDQLVEAALAEARAAAPRRATPRYGRDVEEAVAALAERLAAADVALPWGLPPRAVALLLLEEDDETRAWARDLPAGERILADAEAAAERIAAGHDEPAPIRIARERHGLAGEIAEKVKTRVCAPSARQDRFWRLTTAPATGFPLLAAVLVGLFATLFWMGDYLSTLLTALWEAWASPGIRAAVRLALGEGAAGRSLLWGVDAGVNAALAVGIPYVLTFYLILSVLEDTGYLNAVAFLTDPFMHRLGLHGRAAIPLVAGAGCNVPAIMGTRVLATMRERVLASTLVCLMPCSARTAVIAGAVARYVGWAPAVAIYLIVAGLGFGAGLGQTALRLEQFLTLLLNVAGQHHGRRRLGHEAQREEHDEQGEQEDRQRRHIAGPPALHPFPRQPAGIEGQQRQGPPDAGVEMHDPVQQLLAQVQQGAVHMGRLAAVGAEIPAGRRAAVGTDAMPRLARMPRRLLDRPRDQSPGDRATGPFDIQTPIPRSNPPPP